MLGGLHFQSFNHLSLHGHSSSLGLSEDFGSHSDEVGGLLVVLLLLFELLLDGSLGLGELDLLLLFLNLQFSLNSSSGDLDGLFGIFDGNSLSGNNLSELLLLEFLLKGTLSLVLTDGSHLCVVGNFSSSVGLLLKFLLNARAVGLEGKLGLGSSFVGNNFGGSSFFDGLLYLLISLLDSFDSFLVVDDNDLFVGSSCVSAVRGSLDSSLLFVDSLDSNLLVSLSDCFFEVLDSLLQVSNLLFSFLGIFLGFGSSLSSS